MSIDPNTASANGTIPSAALPESGLNPNQTKVDASGTLDPNQNVIPPKAPAADDLGFTDSQKEYIKTLRDENAKHRVKAKESSEKFDTLNDRFSQLETGLKGLFGEGEQQLTPEEKVNALTQNNEQLQIKTALLELAHEHSIPRDGLEYFEFLLGKKVDGLSEGDELSDEDIQDIAARAKSRNAGSSNGTSVIGGTSGAGQAPTPNIPSDTSLSVDQFAAMNLGEKSALYQKSPEVYRTLVNAAKQEGKLI